MLKPSVSPVVVILSLIFLGSALLSAHELKPIQLPAPETTGGQPLMQVLKERQSRRSFSTEKLPDQELANLLWAAFGVNRPESGKRTAPSAVNWQDVDIYVALARGLYVYDADDHILEPVLAEDIRELTGRQDFTQVAPVNLIYVSDQSRMGNRSQEQKDFYSAVDTGFISQNVYLYCTSAGLATVVLGAVDKAGLAQKMGLREPQKVILTQPVGYPQK